MNSLSEKQIRPGDKIREDVTKIQESFMTLLDNFYKKNGVRLEGNFIIDEEENRIDIEIVLGSM